MCQCCNISHSIGLIEIYLFIHEQNWIVIIKKQQLRESFLEWLVFMIFKDTHSRQKMCQPSNVFRSITLVQTLRCVYEEYTSVDINKRENDWKTVQRWVNGILKIFIRFNICASLETYLIRQLSLSSIYLYMNKVY